MKVRNQPYLTAFGDNLKRIMQDKGSNPETVAAIGEIETKQVYRVINGEHSTTLSVIVDLSDALLLCSRAFLYSWNIFKIY